jgi:putative flippase GtrA
MKTDGTPAVDLPPLSLDLTAAACLGALAGVFAAITAADLGLAARPYLVVPGFVALCLAGIIAARLAGRVSPAIYAFGKFAEVGGLNWLVDLGVLNLLILATERSTGAWFAAFKAVSFLIAATNSYLWNAWWVFRGRAERAPARELPRFALATGTGLLFNVALAYAVARAGPLVSSAALDPKAWANIGGVAGSLGGMLLNFVLYRLWVFRPAAEPVSG